MTFEAPKTRRICAKTFARAHLTKPFSIPNVATSGPTSIHAHRQDLLANDTTPDLQRVERKLIERRIREMLDCRKRGDIPGLVEYFSHDCVLRVSSWQGSPIRVERRGKQACLEFVHHLNILYENLGSTIHKMLIDGHQVAFHRTAKLRNRGSGKTVDIDVWGFLTFRDGLVAEYSEFPDTRASADLEDRAV